MVDQKVAHTFTKRGVFYFSRRVPKALQTRFDRARVVACLHTRSSAKARKLAAALSLQLEMAWAQIRLESVLKRGPTLLITQSQTASSGSSVTLSDAGDIYRRLKSGGKGKGFSADTGRNLRYAQECLGNPMIIDLRRADAGRFRDFLITKKLSTSSIRRVFVSVRAAVNLTISENGLNCTNPFSGTFIPDVGSKTIRPPIPTDVIHTVQLTCMHIDDENRLLIALGRVDKRDSQIS